MTEIIRDGAALREYEKVTKVESPSGLLASQRWAVPNPFGAEPEAFGRERVGLVCPKPGSSL